MPINRSALWLGIANVLLAGSAGAADIVVDDAGDAGQPAGCTLRDAILSANADQAVGNCSPGLGVDTLTITVQPVNDAPIVFTDDPPVIETPIEIRGNSLTTTTIDFGGHGGFRIDDGDPQVSIDVLLEGLTLQNATGQLGGAIDNAESLTIEDVTLTGNTASFGGGIASRGSLVMSNSTVSGNTAERGGGMLFTEAATVTISVSGINDNVATDGGAGGIEVFDGDVTLLDSTVMRNTAASGGGGLELTNATATVKGSMLSENVVVDGAGRGGGILGRNVTISVADSTISDNVLDGEQSQGGGVYLESGSLTVLDASIISGNAAVRAGGGIHAGATVTITVDASEISGNRASIGGGWYAQAEGTLTDSTISGNTAELNGGGVYLRGGSFKVNSGALASNSAFGGAGGGI
ncbi:MAG: right-handed parallel beta-helix repeat-containing protein, partial [Pseudomonadota bacterium]